MEIGYLKVCSDVNAINEINEVTKNVDEMNKYVMKYDKDNINKVITFDPYKFLAHYNENSNQNRKDDGSLDIIKICHCWITFGYYNNLKLSSFSTKKCVEILNKPRICFITSMSKNMYEMYGNKLLEDLGENTRELHRNIIVYSENMNINKEHVFFKSLVDNTWLNEWIKENEDIIPIEYGGKSQEKSGPFRYNASKFIKKVASIRDAIQSYKAEYYLWIDCDTKIKQNIDDNVIKQSFENCDFFYHHGKKREHKQYGIETGLFGFNNNGINIIEKWAEYFKNKNFRKLRRWDDGFVLRHLIIKKFKRKCNDMRLKDLAYNCADWLHPLKSSIWNDYIEHIKGEHYRNGVHKEILN